MLDVFLGMILVLVLNIIIFFGSFFFNSGISILFTYIGISIGLSQLIYVIPLVLWLIKQRKWEFMKGVIIGAVLTALINGGCWILWISSYSR